MHLHLQESCTVFDPESRRHLHRLLGSVIRGWHTLVKPDPSELATILSAEDWDVYGELLKQDYKKAGQVGDIFGPIDCGACDASRLVDFLCLPTVVLVEDATSDGKFYELVTARLRPRVSQHFKGPNRSVNVAHGGGIGNLPREMERLSDNHLKLRQRGLPARFLVVADSDARSPGTRSSAAGAVERAARRLDVDVHILSKRSIENYVPDSALWHYADSKGNLGDAVGRITSLSASARDHYPLKDGLPADVAASNEDESLYPSEFPRQMGLGNFMGGLLDVSPAEMTRRELESRDHSGDLSAMLDLLERNL